MGAYIHSSNNNRYLNFEMALSRIRDVMTNPIIIVGGDFNNFEKKARESLV